MLILPCTTKDKSSFMASYSLVNVAVALTGVLQPRKITKFSLHAAMSEMTQQVEVRYEIFIRFQSGGKFNRCLKQDLP